MVKTPRVLALRHLQCANVLALVLSLAVFVGVSVAEVLSNGIIEMDVSLKTGDQGTCFLHIRIKNIGRTSISFSQLDVPWLEENSLVLMAATIPGRALDPVYSFSHSTGEPVELRPGESIEGDVDLNSRFKDIKEAMQEQDVSIFWSYQLRLTYEKRDLPPLGGWVLIPRQGPGAQGK